MIISISVAIIAIAFAVLVVFLVKVLLAAKDSLDNVSTTLKDVQKTMEELTYEVKQTIRTVNDITANVDHKLKQVDPVVDSVNNLGIVLTEVTEVVKELTFKTKEVTGAVFERMKSAGGGHESAENPHGVVKASTPEDRTLQSYAATYGGKQGAWMNAVDIAVNIWQRMRKSPSR
ncbi:DUF948 domain-containing protein [Paenibacillus wenxiniae]|uniref:DUF948 domain-containing protein n=1 Tax=Paenibacillus wenxiniae TaxID=1636843 RepID=A0ABW4RD13_9BACL